MASARENLAPQVIHRVAREIRQLVRAPPSGIRYIPQDEGLLTEVYVEIEGPENTPYDGGFFMVRLSLSDGFPLSPPKGVFLTKIFHPNIATNGEICVNTLKKDWDPDVGIAHVLQVIRCLLIVPFPESALNDEAGRLIMESYEEYARRARLWTNIHAPKVSSAKNQESEMKPTTICTTKDLDDDSTKLTMSNQTEDDTGKNDNDSVQAGEISMHFSTKSTTIVAGTPVTKKRASPTAIEISSAQKKKAAVKKGIRRL